MYRLYREEGLAMRVRHRRRILLFNGKGDCLGATLRPGNIHSAEEWEEGSARNRAPAGTGSGSGVSSDAAFAKPEIYEALEERGVKYAIRLPANAGLERDIEEL